MKVIVLYVVAPPIQVSDLYTFLDPLRRLFIYCFVNPDLRFIHLLCVCTDAHMVNSHACNIFMDFWYRSKFLSRRLGTIGNKIYPMLKQKVSRFEFWCKFYCAENLEPTRNR